MARGGVGGSKKVDRIPKKVDAFLEMPKKVDSHFGGRLRLPWFQVHLAPTSISLQTVCANLKPNSFLKHSVPRYRVQGGWPAAQKRWKPRNARKSRKNKRKLEKRWSKRPERCPTPPLGAGKKVGGFAVAVVASNLFPAPPLGTTICKGAADAGKSDTQACKGAAGIETDVQNGAR